MADPNGYKYHDHVICTDGFFIGCTGILVDYSENLDCYSIKFDMGNMTVLGISADSFTQRRFPDATAD